MRELEIENHSDSGYSLALLDKCADTLECFRYKGLNSLNAYARKMPKLSDLYIWHCDDLNIFLSYNYQSLEFIFLTGGMTIQTLDYSLKMEKVEIVVITFLDENKLPVHADLDREKMFEICPNAEVIIMHKGSRKEIQHQIRSRCRKKKFQFDLPKCILYSPTFSISAYIFRKLKLI